MRNEAARLPYFLTHHRGLGVDHFLIVDNDSADDTAAFLRDQPDVSLWQTRASYRDARFGVSWLTWLLMRYGAGHWCLTLDGDELLIYPHHDRHDLHALAAELDRRGRRSFRTLMIELYPKGPLDQQHYVPGQDPREVLPFFDGTGFVRFRHPEFHSLVEKGGVRARIFGAGQPARFPPMHKTPFVRWSRRYAYADSTHTLLPRRLNRNYGKGEITGALLHTKFLPDVVIRSAEPAHRAQHFADPQQHTDYFDALAAAPDFWHPEALRYEGWQQLARLQLLSEGDWSA